VARAAAPMFSGFRVDTSATQRRSNSDGVGKTFSTGTMDAQCEVPSEAANILLSAFWSFPRKPCNVLAISVTTPLENTGAKCSNTLGNTGDVQLLFRWRLICE